MKAYQLFFIVFSTFSMNAFGQAYINTFEKYAPKHDNKISIMFGVNPSLLKASDLSSFTLSYARKMENHHWLEFNYQNTSGLFSKFSANNQDATKATDEELAEQKNSLMNISFNYGIESNYIQDFLNFKDTFEYMSAGIGYYRYAEDYSGESYSGPGMHAKFQIYKRVNDYFSLGSNLNYHLAFVKRAAIDDMERSSKRSLTLGFMTVGFDINFYL